MKAYSLGKEFNMLKIDPPPAACDDLSLELMGYLIPVTLQAFVNRISTDLI